MLHFTMMPNVTFTFYSTKCHCHFLLQISIYIWIYILIYKTQNIVFLSGLKMSVLFFDLDTKSIPSYCTSGFSIFFKRSLGSDWCMIHCTMYETLIMHAVPAFWLHGFIHHWFWKSYWTVKIWLIFSRLANCSLYWQCVG